MQMTVTEARRRWSEVLDRVERGETIRVSRRGKIIAAFSPSLPIPAGETSGPQSTRRAD